MKTRLVSTTADIHHEEHEEADFQPPLCSAWLRGQKNLLKEQERHRTKALGRLGECHSRAHKVAGKLDLRLGNP